MRYAGQDSSCSIDHYLLLMREHPRLAGGRVARPIVLDRDALIAYTRANDVKLGVLAETPYALLLVDLVAPELDLRNAFPYMRVMSRSELNGGTNAAVVPVRPSPTAGDDVQIVLIEQERHATGRRHLEIPRGFGSPGEGGQMTARRELQEEAGYSCHDPVFLGNAYVDTGLLSGHISYYSAVITDRTEGAPEEGEAIVGVHEVPLRQVVQLMAAGHIDDGITLQGIALYLASAGHLR